MAAATAPLRSSWIDIQPNATWMRNGHTVAGGNDQGNELNQLSKPRGLYVDDDQTIYVADTDNHRIVEWKYGAENGLVVAGDNGEGNGAHQLKWPQDVIVDKTSDSLIISDCGNERVVRWPRRNGTSGETIISNINCRGLTMDENGFLYVVDQENHEVRRYRIGDTEGTVVAGVNGNGRCLDQLDKPWYIFVDRNHSVYVSDSRNHRVMKWEEGAQDGIVVAGLQGYGHSRAHLKNPKGVVVDQLGTVYVAESGKSGSHRIMRWPEGAAQGSIISNGNSEGEQSNEFFGLSFDRDGNLYVVDHSNHRVQKFDIDRNG